MHPCETEKRRFRRRGAQLQQPLWNGSIWSLSIRPRAQRGRDWQVGRVPHPAWLCGHSGQREPPQPLYFPPSSWIPPPVLQGGGSHGHPPPPLPTAQPRGQAGLWPVSFLPDSELHSPPSDDAAHGLQTAAPLPSRALGFLGPDLPTWLYPGSRASLGCKTELCVQLCPVVSVSVYAPSGAPAACSPPSLSASRQRGLCNILGTGAGRAPDSRGWGRAGSSPPRPPGSAPPRRSLPVCAFDLCICVTRKAAFGFILSEHMALSL